MYLTQPLHRLLRQAPDAVLTRCAERTHTVRESTERVARLAGALRGLGMAEGDRIGILAVNSDHYHVAVLATWWAGGAVNPVNVRWSPAEIAYSLVDSDTGILMVDEAFAPMIPALRAASPCLTHVIRAGGGDRAANELDLETLIDQSPPAEDAVRGNTDLAGIFYTGGTTGHPKGVMLSHANMMTSVLGLQATSNNVIPDGHSLAVAPMFHLAGLGAWYAQLVAGGSFTFLPGFDPVQVLDVVEHGGVTSLLLVPTMIQMLIDEVDRNPRDLSTVQRIGYGASPISEPLLARAFAAFPNASFSQGYGMTELAPGCSILRPEDHERRHKLTSAGRPARHMEVKIVDALGAELPRGEIGEIVARGGNVMLGYWNKPEETATAIRDGWLHTGDAGRMDEEGYLHVVDRIKDMIITGGENVYSAEVEKALLTHASVHQVAVIGLPDDHYGERVHAVVVLLPGHTVTLDELRTHAKSLIAGYKAPRSVEFVVELPLSAAGKVLKRELRRQRTEAAPVP